LFGFFDNVTEHSGFVAQVPHIQYSLLDSVNPI